MNMISMRCRLFCAKNFGVGADPQIKTQRKLCDASRIFAKRGVVGGGKGHGNAQLYAIFRLYLGENDLENEIFVLKEQRFLSPVQADSLDRKKLAAFFESELFARMENSEKLLREQRFIMEIPARRLDPTLPEKVANEPIAVQGIADCIFFENGQPIIVDYKTDLVSDEQVLRERYSAQLDIYAEAFEKNSGTKGSAKAYIFLCPFKNNRALDKIPRLNQGGDLFMCVSRNI